ncbi:hypothetical protein ROZALSC1DRAFT_28857 [Rozella allomycis CSF55]|uniref:aspartate transaminase n=1 Tax=Rozella allomycis (strain CSF55) TaxID=988480 RepID=A0A4P9YLZ6_ROZAC|nr:hypothetical protein ROZALSC1DRAFT_28857 [Rozella allomycis CSF55]
MFENVTVAPPDPIFNIFSSYLKDESATKVNVGIGAYRTDEGKPWVLPVVRKVENMIVNSPDLDHEYLPLDGLKSFTDASAKLILGNNSPVILEKRYCAVQSISGTGAVRLGADFLKRFHDKTVYLPNPTWANHQSIFEDAGFTEILEYPYYNPKTKGLDINNLCDNLKAMKENSIVLFHACAHNPTGVDPKEEEWTQIAKIMKEKKLFPFFDCAYQGFASGSLDKDAWSVRHFVEQGFELLVAQSYSKNFGLYSERCGCLTVACQTPAKAEAVRTQLCKINRTVISTPPAFGARIVSKVLNDPELYKEWVSSLKEMAGRIKLMRRMLFDELINLGTPGNWNHIIDQIGMFTYTGLTKEQCLLIRDKFHVYMTESGRVSMAGLNTKNVKYFANSIDQVVRMTLQ